MCNKCSGLRHQYLTLCIISWQPNEDVTYASIDHGPGKGSRTTRATTDDDCDYATVNVPAALQPKTESECSSKEECDDDYVLMG